MRGIARAFGDFPPTIFGKGFAMMKSIIAASVLSLGVASAGIALPRSHRNGQSGKFERRRASEEGLEEQQLEARQQLAQIQ